MIHFKKILTVLIVFILWVMNAEAQNENKFDSVSHKEIGLSFTHFVAQFVPLNIRTIKDGPIGYSYKKYGKNNIAFRFGFGANVNLNQDEEDIFLSMRLGYERRRHLFHHFYMTRGWDFMGFVGSLNLPNQDNNSSEEAGIGLGPFIGFEYHINNSLIVSTESMLFVGLSPLEGPIINIIPPSALFLIFRF